MKKVWVGTSWKMNKTAAEAAEWTSSIKSSVTNINEHVQAFVIPPFPYIKQVVDSVQPEGMLVGSQNMCWNDSGAFTGEISPIMLNDLGVNLVEIGHSERRAMFGETDETVNLKVRAALKHGMRPLVCVGDTLQEKQWNVSTETVVRQVKIALHNVTNEDLTKVILAYEPVWAIGEAGIPATAEEASKIHSAIRHALALEYGSATAKKIVLLYGGSVNLDNAKELLEQDNIDGVFVGRTAWNAQGYQTLVQIAQTVAEGSF